MPTIIEITDFSAPELDVYARYSEVQLLNRHEPEKDVYKRQSFSWHFQGPEGREGKAPGRRRRVRTLGTGFRIN